MKSILDNFSIPTKLFFLVLVLCLVITGIGLYGLGQLKNLNRTTQTLYADRVVCERQLATVGDAYAGILLTVQQLKLGDVSVEQAAERLEKAQTAVDTNWRAYKQTYLTPDEATMAADMERYMLQVQVPLEKAKMAIATGNMKALDHNYPGLRTSLEQAIAQSKQLINLQVEISRQLLEGSNRVYRSTAQKFYVFITLSLLFAAGIAFWILGDAWKLIRRLEDSNLRISKSEAKCRAFVEHAGDAIMILGNNFNITEVNNSACMLYGYTRSELTGMNIADTVYSDELQSQAAIKDLLRQGRGSVHERKGRRKDGSPVDTEINVQPLQGYGYVAIIRDITERKKAEEEIKRLNRLYQFVSRINESMLKLDTKEEIFAEACNIAVEVGKFQMAWIGTYNEQNDRIIPTSWSGLEDGFFKSIGDAAFKVSTSSIPSAWAIRTKSHFHYDNIEYDASIPDEVKKEMLKRNYRSALSFPIFIDSKIVAAFVLLMSEPFFFTEEEVKLIKDVTDNITYALDKIRIRDLQNKAEEGLKQSEERYRAFIQYAGDSILIMDYELRITDMNDSACALFGYSSTELIGMKVSDIVMVQELESHHSKLEVLKNAGVSMHQRKFRRKDGNEVDTEVNVRVLEGIGYIAIIRDIKERKKAELALREREAQLTALFENIEGATSLLDEEKKYVLFNRRFIQDNRLLTKKDPYVGQDAYEGFPEAVRNERLKTLDSVLKGHKEVLEVDYLRDGKRVYYRTSFSPVINDGKVTGISTHSIDLTKSKEAEEKIRQSEEKHRALTENISDAILLINEHAQVIYQSPALERIAGYRLGEDGNKEVFEFVHPDDVPVSTTYFQQAMAMPGVSPGQFRMQHRQGHYIWIEGTMMNLLHNESIKAVIVNFRDITERIKAALAIKESEEKYHSLIEHAADSIFIVGDDGIIVDVNHSACELLRCSREDLVGEKVSDARPAGAQENVTGQKADNKLLMERRWRRNDGTKVDVEVSWQVFEKRALLIVRDITERKKAEEQQALMTSIVNSSDDAIISNTLDGMVTSWNRGAEQVLGYTTGEMIGQPISKVIPDDVKEDEKTMLSQIALGYSIDHIETSRIKKDGTLIYVSLTVSPIRDAQGTVVGASRILRDITDRKKAEAEIAALNESLEQKVIDRTAQLQEAIKGLEGFSYSVSHDLKAPARAITGFANIIENEYAPGFSPDLKELFTHIRDSGKRMTAIIDDLLKLAKYEKIMPQQKMVDMDKLFGAAWDKINIYGGGHRATLKMDALPPASVDPSLMEQVVVNLLSNAVKYSSKKENPMVTVGFERGDDTITYMVKDNGAGFDMKNYNKLFGAFQRLHGSSEFEGTGVGLLLVKRIIEKHGGVIRAEGVVNEGATFYFTLPAIHIA